MGVRTRSRLLVILTSLITAIAIALPLTVTASAQVSTPHAKAAQTHMTINCEYSDQCTEVQNDEEVFGDWGYVGHDEPSVLFYSNRPGSGNQMTYTFKLPTDPKPGPGNVPKPGQSFTFELGVAFWFGMAMCATESYPLQVKTCTPDSDSNIYDGQDAAHPLSLHPGTAFMEMQFYPPGWVSWPAGISCSATQWCAALNIDSLAEDPINGTVQNSTCVDNVIGSPEYVNFAFITKSGHSQAPANPVDSTLATYTPDPTQDLFMNPGDSVITSMHDTPNGLRIDIIDLTTHQAGSMTASAANGFGQVQYDPTGTSCNNIPYNFHPMYSTSSEHTRVIWAAHSYNIAFDDEIGHFEACNGPNAITPGGNCPAGNTEYDGEPSDSNDTNCYPASMSTLIQVNGCTEGSGITGFDSMPYQTLWPDGNTRLHPTSLEFTSPVTGFGHQYERVAFEANLPRIEVAGLGSGNNCNRATGQGCTLIPITDDGQPANFYPFYSIHRSRFGPCTWLFGNDVRGLTTNDFGKNNQYGSLLFLNYLVFGGGGSLVHMTDNFRQILNYNPCPAF
ncbi:MAG TPA: hypothetical protein VKX46_17200 [Ktedonobacteraceae bacterium]|jgi:hypothetical protein|nr:hypothetical protein [Ktedonobacteraceae bacterium]HLI70526.1 hypothetical protein [Ktedonobacteraceae bacterium]